MLPLMPFPISFPASTMKSKIRFLSEKDFEQIIVIDKLCFTEHLDDERLQEFFNNRRTILFKVMDVGGKVVGFHIYTINSGSIDIIKLGIHPDYRRLGYGTRFIKETYRKLNHKRNKLCCAVSEYSDGGIAFLRSHGFVATSVRRKEYEDGSDAYCFRLVLPEAVLVK